MAREPIYAALLFALIAAVGNALFAFGQKRSVASNHPFLFIMAALVFCFLLFLVVSLFLPRPKLVSFARHNWRWVLISGLGFWLTFIGFYFLYSRYGASHYVVYAVLSIVATSIVVGVLIFKEAFNRYHLLSVVTALLTVVLFAAGQSRGG
jgi:drug/metabolite transporter (DMT)-like permease